MFDPNSSQYDSLDAVAPAVFYLICSTPRSGSRLLCRTLWDTGIAGYPHEYFHGRKHMPLLHQRWQIKTMDAYLQKLKAHRSTSNGVFGFKMHYRQYQHELNHIDLFQYFPDLKLIYIHREDHIRQAISFARAMQTKQWSSEESPQCKAQFDPNLITNCLQRIHAEEKGWEQFFRTNEISPLRVTYEHFISSFDQMIEATLKHIGLDYSESGSIPQAPITKIADRLSDDWYERFTALASNCTTGRKQQATRLSPSANRSNLVAVPKISVLIYCYNFSAFIKECIESVLAQTLKPFEICVLDDCSTDNSWQIIQALHRQYPGRLKPYRHTKNIGMTPNGNFGMKRACGDWVTWIDGDDWWRSDKLELEWRLLTQHPDALMAYSNVTTIDADGNQKKTWDNEHSPQAPSGDIFINVFAKRFFPNGRNVFRNHLQHRSVFDGVGYMDENLKVLVDWDFKIRASKQFRIVYNPKPVVAYRLHTGGIHHTQVDIRRSDVVDIFSKNVNLLQDLTFAQQKFVIKNVASIYKTFDPDLHPLQVIAPIAAEAGMGDAAREALKDTDESGEGFSATSICPAIKEGSKNFNSPLAHMDMDSMKKKNASHPSGVVNQATCGQKGTAQPRISVFITSYNQKDLLAEAIESVLGQTLPPWEIIVVDDASEDGSQALIHDYAQQYSDLIKPLFHKTNTGVTRSRIDALQHVSGDYVTYVDGDDRFLATKLEKEYDALCRTPSAQIAFSNNYYMNADGEHFGMWIDDEKPPEGNVFVQTFGRIYPKHSLYRMELVDYKAWKSIGFHDVNLTIYEDFDMRIRMTKQLQTVYCDEPLSEIRYHGGGLSNSRGQLHQKSLDYIFEKNRDLLADLKSLDRKIAEKGFKGWRDNATEMAIKQITANNDSGAKENSAVGRSSNPPASKPDFRLNLDYRGHNLIFLISQPRAGSTLLQRMIAGHADIHATAEPWIMLHPLYALKRTGIQTEYRADLAYDGLTDFLSQFHDGASVHLQSLRLQAAYLYGQALNQTGKEYFLDKTPRYYNILPELYRVFPQAKFILLFRNPLAVFSSTLKTWLNNDLNQIDPATRVDLYEAPQRLVEGVLDLKENAFVAHYEQIVAHPHQELKRLCAYLEIAYNDDLLEYGTRPAPEGRFGDPQNVHRHRRPVKSYIDQWMENLAEPQLNEAAERLLVHIGESTLAQMGYRLPDLQKKLASIRGTSAPNHEIAERARDLMRQGEALVNGQKPAEAIEAFKAILRIQPANAEAYNNIGVAYCRMNEFTAALDSYRKAVALDEENACYQKNLADLCCFTADRLEEAAAIYTGIIASNPLDTDALMGMAHVCLANNQFKDALEFCSNVQAIDPQNCDVGPLIDRINQAAVPSTATDTVKTLQSRIKTYVAQGQLSQVARDLEELIQHDPESAVAHNDLGVIYSQLGDTQKTEACYRRAVALDPENATFQKNLADYLYVIAGQVDTAETIYRSLIQTCPHDVEVWLSYGKINADQNRFDEAQCAFEKALALEPDNPMARQFTAAMASKRDDQSPKSIEVSKSGEDTRSSCESRILDDRIPVLIYQMGKVGSTTVRDSLESHGIYNQHTHLLSWEGIERAENRYRDLADGRAPDRIRRYRALRELIDRAPNDTCWKIITLVRDPIARLISSVFQNLNVLFPDVKKFDDDLLPRIEQHILNRLDRFEDEQNGDHQWFDNELKQVFGFDIFQTAFDSDKGYQIYRNVHLEVLAVQLEHLTNCATEAFGTFLGLEKFRLTHANESRTKPYREIYRKLLASIAIPETVIERVYKSRLVRHFYAQSQIETFKQRWRWNNHKSRIGWTEPRMRVTAVVSTYNSERFLEERLRNLVDQSLYQKGQLEIIVIDSNSEQNEEAIVNRMRQNHPGIKYIRTPVRESVYAAWNRGIKSSSGTYFVNANTDDRFATDALEVLADTLDANPDYDIAYGNWLITNEENDSFESSAPKSQMIYPAYHPPLLFYLFIGTHANFVRRRVFDNIGLFDGSLQVFGDREFMLRFACAGLKAFRVERTLGLYLENPDSLARRTADAQKNEWWPLVERYSQTLNFLKMHGCDHVPENRAIAKLYTEAGCLGHELWSIDGEPVSSIGPSPHLFAKAIEHDPTCIEAINNLAVLKCNQAEARQFFEAALDLAHGAQKKLVEENLGWHREGVTDISRYHFMKSPHQKYRIIQNKLHSLGNLQCMLFERANPSPSQNATDHSKTANSNSTAAATTEENLESQLQKLLRRLQEQPDDVETLLSLGSLCTTLERVEDALDFYLDALAADDHCREAAGKMRRLLQRLETKKKSLIITDRSATRKKQLSPRVSAIVSVYNAERYLTGCLKNLVAQTIADQLEIIVIDSGSQQNEAAIVKAFQSTHQNIRYVRTEERESVYAAWNHGIKIAKGDYITNANADDRHRADALEIMADTLDQNPDIALVYADCVITERENETFSRCTPVGSFRWREWNRDELLGGDCFIGPQPMWRRSLHRTFGYFDESFETSGDYEFWCRIARSHEFKHINELLGLYLRSSQSIEHRNEDLKVSENQIIMERYGGVQGGQNTGGPVSNAMSAASPLTQAQAAAFLRNAVKLYEKEDYATALEYVLKVIAVFPDCWEAYPLVVQILLQSGPAADVIGRLWHSLEKREDLPSSVIAQIGYLYDAADDLTMVESLLEAAFRRDVSCPWALNLAGIRAYRRGDSDAATNYFQKALTKNSKWGDPWTNLGVMGWEQGQTDNAFECFEKGFILSPTAPHVATSYHTAVAATKQYERSRPLWEKATQAHPAFRKGWYFLIDALINLHDYAAAMAAIESVILRFGTDAEMLVAAIQIRRQLGPIEIAEHQNAVSLCMIARNEEQHLARCLNSLKPVVDEIIVVDTGSSDSTKDIATVFGAKVYDFPWVDDFAAARNFSISKAKGRWIFVMDADEIIAPSDHKRLKSILHHYRSDNVAFSITTRNYTNLCNLIGWEANDRSYPAEEAGTGWTPSTKVRLFPNHTTIRFEYPVHEVVRPSLAREGVKVLECSVPVHHYGYLNQVRATAKGETYYQIGIKKLQKMAHDPLALRELAVQAELLGHHQEAVKLWLNLLAIEPDNARAHINLSTAYGQLGNYRKARDAALKASELDNGLKEAHFNAALAELYLGRSSEAAGLLKPLVLKHRRYYAAEFMLGCARICCNQAPEGLAIISKLQSTPLWETIRISIDEIVQGLTKAGRENDAEKIRSAADELGLPGTPCGRSPEPVPAASCATAS